MKIIACPVVLHPDGALRRIAVLQDPSGDLQLVKAAAPDPEDATGAAARALYAMSALETRAALPIGTSNTINADEVWHFALCRIVPPVREQWKHLDANSSKLLHFSWMSLDASFDGFCAQDKRALDWIKATL